MLTQTVEGRHCGPVVYCDVCQERITDAKDGNVQWMITDTDGQVRDRAEIYFTHKRCCHAFDAQHGEVISEGVEKCQALETAPAYPSGVTTP
jgi:hypothetical protein